MAERREKPAAKTRKPTVEGGGRYKDAYQRVTDGGRLANGLCERGWGKLMRDVEMGSGNRQCLCEPSQRTKGREAEDGNGQEGLEQA